MLKDFSILSCIGKGTYAKVLLVRHLKDNQLYALKVLKKKIYSRKKSRKTYYDGEVDFVRHRTPLFGENEDEFSRRAKALLPIGILSWRIAVQPAGRQGQTNRRPVSSF